MIQASEVRPSSSPRYLVCPGSVVLSRDRPDAQGEYADVGSRQHRLAEILLKRRLVGRDESVELEYVKLLNQGLDVDGYVHWAEGLVQPGDTVLIEQRVSTADIVKVPGASGSLDFAIVRADEKSILIADRKFPWGKPVYAEGEDEDSPVRGHPPMMIYALGLLDTFDGILFDKSNIESIELAIYQENKGRSDATDTWTCGMEYLESFRSMVAAGIARIRKAEEEFGKEGWEQEYLHPGVTQCKYCKANGDCPRLAHRALSTVANADVKIKEDLGRQLEGWELRLVDMDDGKLEEMYELLPLIGDWVKAVKWQMYMRMLDMGIEMKRHKLVEGRMGNRKWSDPCMVVELVGDEAFSKEIIDPPGIEKKVKSGKVPKEIWEVLQSTIERKPGKPTIALREDEREEAVSLPEVIPCDLLPPV
jgi:hypothetical protein